MNLTFNIHSVQNNCCNLGTAQKGGGSDPCQDFSGEFEQSFARILNNLLPGFWNTRALSIVASRIYALFVAKSTSVPGLGGGGGGLSQSWQCQDFGSSGYCNPSLTMIVMEHAEAQKPRTFRIAAFYAQKFSGRSARIHFSRHIKKRVVLSHDISKKCVTLSRH